MPEDANNPIIITPPNSFFIVFFLRLLGVPVFLFCQVPRPHQRVLPRPVFPSGPCAWAKATLPCPARQSLTLQASAGGAAFLLYATGWLLPTFPCSSLFLRFPAAPVPVLEELFLCLLLKSRSRRAGRPNIQVS